MEDLEINYVLVAIKRENFFDAIKNDTPMFIIHAVGFENEPKWNDYIGVYKELSEDEEFGLINEDIIVIKGTDDMVQYHRERIELLKVHK